MRVRVRLFAIQRVQTGLRELDLELPTGAVRGRRLARPWSPIGRSSPAAEGSVRFARNGVYADEADVLADGRRAGGHPAGRGRSRRSRRPTGPPAHRADRGAARRRDRIASLLEAVPTAADGAVATFVGQTRETPGTPAPGQEAEAARFAGQRVEGLEYEAFEPMALAVLERDRR